MADKVGNLTLEYSRRLDRKVDALAEDLREARNVLSGVAQILACRGMPTC
jgi:hypothetical protein